MKKAIILSICIATIITTDAVAMLSRAVQPTARRFSTASRSFSTRSGVGDAEKALSRLEAYKNKLEVSSNVAARESERDIQDINALPWYSRWALNFAGKRSDIQRSANINNAQAILDKSAARELSGIETEFNQALDEIKRELAETKKALAEKDKYVFLLELQARKNNINLKALKKEASKEPTMEELKRKKFVESVPLGLWGTRFDDEAAYEKWKTSVTE